MKMRYLFWGWYAIGLVLMLAFYVPDFLHFSNGLFLIFFALYAIQLEVQNRDTFMQSNGILGNRPLSIVMRALVVGVVTYVLEGIGTQTGYPFGTYHYSHTLSLFGESVPIAIGFAWIGVMSSAILLSTATSRWVRALQAGLWALLFDLVLDPVAFSRGFWEWQGHGIYAGVPWQNFASWFVTAFLLSWLYPLRISYQKPLAEGVRLYQGMLLMFGILGIKEGLYTPFMISLVGSVIAEGVLRYDRSTQKQKL